MFSKGNLSRLIIVTAILLTAVFSANARVYLVSVGIADYSAFPAKINSLRLPTNDAKSIVELYAMNTSVDYALLLNEKATKERIIKAIKKVFNSASDQDIVVFFFSGHGYPGGVCAYDGNVSYNKIRKAISGSKSKNKMMFVDACRSGGMRIEKKSNRSLTSPSHDSNVMLFLSSRNNENSIEKRTMQNGYFTTYLQNGLKGAADFDSNAIITAKELFDYVHTGVAKVSMGKQHPVMWGKFDDDMPVMIW